MGKKAICLHKWFLGPQKIGCDFMGLFFKSNKNYKGYTLIEGFPSADLISSITTKYLIENLKMDYLGHFEHDNTAPIVKIENGIPQHPIRAYVTHKHKLICIISDQIIQKEDLKSYCHIVLNWAKKSKMERILSIGGIIDNNETILGVANNKKNLSYLEKYNIQKIKEGITAGIGAQFFILEKDYPIYLILVPFLQTKNYDAAAKAIGLLNKMYNLNIDNKPLLAESKKLSEIVNSQMKEVKEKEKNGHNMYI